MNASGPQAYTIRGVDAMPAALARPLHLAPVEDTATRVDCDGGRWSSDGGLVLRNAPDDHRGFTRHVAAVLRDRRDPRRVDVTLHDLRKQRVVHMAAGSEEAHDANPRRDDPLCTLRLGRLPARGTPLASQPPRARCANRVSRTALSRLARGCVEQCIASSARPPTRIGLDCEATEAPAHGQQEQARYEGYAGGSCVVPLHGYAGLAGRLLTTLCKAKRFSGAPRLAVLQRLRTPRRHAWPGPRLGVRGDRHCASPEVRQGIEAQAHRSAVTGLTSHAVVQPLAHEVVEQATRASARDGGQGTRFHATRSQAGTGARARRVVLTVEVPDHGVTTRWVVTDLEPARAQGL